jgi:hypothetical protein
MATSVRLVKPVNTSNRDWRKGFTRKMMAKVGAVGEDTTRKTLPQFLHPRTEIRRRAYGMKVRSPRKTSFFGEE